MNNNRKTVNSKKSSNKGSKPNYRGNRKPKDKERDLETRDYEATEQSTNDVNWYFASQEMFNQASRLSFQNFLGRPIIDSVKVPTVATMYTNPSVGVSVKYDNTGYATRSGLNLAAQRLYTKLNIFSGRASNYAPQDVAIMLGAMAELISMFEYARRAFGIVLFYNERNRDIPTRLLTAMGIDAADFYDNQANYRKKFNKLVQSIDQLPLIMNITYMQKAMFMYQRIYTDSESLMAQMYMFAPASTWILDETMNEHGSVLKTMPVCMAIDGSGPVNVDTMANRLKLINQMVDALLNSSSLNTVYADIYNLANKSSEVKLFKMDLLADNYSVEPVYDKMILNQIHNSDIMGVPTYPRGAASVKYVQRTPFNDVYCNPDVNMIVYNPAMIDKSNLYVYPATNRGYKLIDLHTSNPTDEEVAESTRLAGFFYPGTPAADLKDANNNQLRLAYTLGDHYVTEIIISGNSTVDDPEEDVIVYSNNTYWGIYQSTTSAITGTQATSVFEMFPLFYEYDIANNVVNAIRGEVDFNTRIDREWLDGINDIVMLDMFTLRNK